MFLIDTDVLSRIRVPDETTRRVTAWLNGADDRFYLSWISIAEVEKGVARAWRIGATTKARILGLWLEAVKTLYGERILAFDDRAAGIAGRMMDASRAHQPGFADVAIAAIAKSRDFVLVTANERHFAPLGVELFNPFSGRPIPQ